MVLTTNGDVLREGEGGSGSDAVVLNRRNARVSHNQRKIAPLIAPSRACA